MFDWMKNHKKLIAFITFMIIFGIPFIIHVLFKLHSNIDFFVAEWTAGELLSYYGSILAFLGTVILGALSLYQNQIIKQESGKRATLLEQRERESNMPRFRINHVLSHGNSSGMKFNIENISTNIANNILIGPVKIVNKSKETIWSQHSVVHVETCILLSRKKSSGKSAKIEIEIDLNEADRRECIGTATYQEIKDYIWEHYQTKVSHLYIAQIKKKCGLDVGENFNKPKTEGNKVPNCPPEKERMIREALEYFGMINKE